MITFPGHLILVKVANTVKLMMNVVDVEVDGVVLREEGHQQVVVGLGFRAGISPRGKFSKSDFRNFVGEYHSFVKNT